jgi:hypothetical protein
LALAIKIDVTKCERCNGDMAVMAAIIDRSEVARYLKHVGMEHEAPTRAPPRYKEESFDFGPRVLWRRTRDHTQLVRVLIWAELCAGVIHLR